ncbi:MAG: DUF1778 domain-containing protein [Acidimicrobiia bacterium]
MHLSAAMTSLETAVDAQLAVAGPEVAEVGTRLLAVLQPALRQTLLEAVEMAAAEVSGQLEGQRVDIRMVDGEPELVVVDEPALRSGEEIEIEAEDSEARITLRLPQRLKELIAEAAELAGDSVNSYVVEALQSQAKGKRRTADRTRKTIQL